MKKGIGIEKIFINQGKWFHIVFSVIVLSFIPLVYLFVYKTGGIKFVFSHSMYFPILIASILWGIRGGVIVAIIGGIALGPFMPLDIATNEKQLLINWIYRLLFFIITGISVGFFSDLLKKYIKRIHYITMHNPETDLPNMSYIEINEDLDPFLKNKDLNVFCILWNNIDDIINCFGYDLCISIVKELDQLFRFYFHNRYRLIYSDISRLFVIIRSSNPEVSLEKLRHLTNNAVSINNIPFFTDFSIGMAPYSKQKFSLEAFQQASIASSYAKKTNTFTSIYDEKKILLNEKNLRLLGEFSSALKNNKIQVYYQPKMNMKTKKCIGMEALIRWHHDEHGTIYPGDFIPLLEESDLINPLTEYVLDQVLFKLEEFMKSDLRPVISVNISPVNLQNPRFLERIIRIFDKHNVNSELVEFEITEVVLVRNPEYVKFLLQNLKNYKIVLSIDDFGTGYSSLSYLSRFPIDIIKIDKFFIKQMMSSKDVYFIVKAAIDLAKNLGLKVVAEGIEDEEVVKQLLTLGCRFGQGYFFSKPMKEGNIFDWYNKHV